MIRKFAAVVFVVVLAMWVKDDPGGATNVVHSFIGWCSGAAHSLGQIANGLGGSK